jgi:hypothetical protein
MLDPAGPELTDDDRRRLRHPAAGGAILFTRNFTTPQQLQALTEEIHALRAPALLIAVDHEGGRVQRFREGFSALPPMRTLGQLWDRDREAGRAAAHAAGYVIGAELAAHGLDFSFAPSWTSTTGAAASSAIGPCTTIPSRWGRLRRRSSRVWAKAEWERSASIFPDTASPRPTRTSRCPWIHAP